MAGGYDIGSIFGTLELDDKRFQDAVRGSAALTKLLKMDIDSLGNTMASLRQTLTQAGYNFDNIAKSINTLHFSGMKGAEGVKVVTDALREFQQRAREVQQIDLGKLTQYQIGAGWNARDREYQRGLPQNRFDYAVGPTASGVGVISASTKLAQEEAMWGQYEAGNKKHLDKVNRDNQEALSQDLAARKKDLSERNRAAIESFNLQKREADRTYEQRKGNEAALTAAIAKEQKARLDLERQKDREVQALFDRAAQDERRRIQKQHEQYFEFRRLNAMASGLQQIGVAAVAMGAVPVAGIGFAAKQYAGLDEAMTRSLSIMQNVTDYQRNQMEVVARNTAKEVGRSAAEMAGAYYELKSAGMSVNESIAQLPIVTKFSIAANADLTRSTKLLTDAMSGLGLQSKDLVRISDVLVKADMEAKGKAIEFAEALAGKGGGALRIVNKSLEEGVAVLMAYAKVGITGQNAQEALNQSLRDFARTEMKNKVVEVNGEMFKFGQLLYDNNGKMKPYWEVLRGLEDRLEGLSDKNRRAVLQMAGFQDRSIKSITSILGLSDTMKQYYDSLHKAGGATEEVANKQLEAFNKQLAIVKQRLNDMVITLGKPAVAAFRDLLDVINPVIKAAESLAQAFDKLPDPIRKTMVAAGGIAGGGLLAGGGISLMLGQYIRLIADLKYLQSEGMFTGMFSRMSGLGSALRGGASALGGGAGLAAIGVGAGTAAFLTWLLNVSDASARVSTNTNQIITNVNQLDAALRNSPYFNAALSAEYINAHTHNKSVAMGGTYLPKPGDIESGGYRNQGPKGALDMGALAKAVGRAFPAGGTVRDPKADAEAAAKAAQERSQAFQALGLEDYALKLDNLRKAYEKLKGVLSDSQMETVKANILNLESIIANGSDPSRSERLNAATETMQKRYEEDVKDYIELATKANEADLQWASSQSALAREMDGTLQKIHEIAVQEITIEGSNRRPKGVSAVSWSTKGLDPTLASRLPPGVFEVVAQQNQVNEWMKSIGGTSQAELNYEAQRTRGIYQDLAKVAGDSAYETRLAWVRAMEAQARATHDASILVSSDYRRIKASVEDTVDSANRAWQRHTQALRRQISSVLTDFSANTFDILWPRQGAQADKLAPLVSQLRSAFESITKMGYSNPAGALGEVIGSIIKAGSTAEANAIAIRHFGNEGVLLAKNLRDGSISAEDLASALQKATASIQSYAEQTEKKTNKVKELWREMVRGIVRSLVEDLGNALNEHIRLAERLEGILGKVFGKGGSKSSGIPGVSGDPLGDAGTALGWPGYGGSSTPPTVPGGGGGGVPSGGGGGIGSAATGWMGYANLAMGAGTMISSIVGNFQMAGMNKSLDLIEHEVRYSQIHLYNILNLMNNFLPNLQWINEAIYTQIMPAMAMLNDSILNRMSGTAGTLQVTIGEIVLPNVTDGESLIRDLKALRAV